MYCYHCGYEIDENKIEKKASTRQKYINDAPLDADINYVCPRCGHLIHAGCEEKDTRNLATACHAELQRGRNAFARGMSLLSIAIILGAISFIFFLLSKKADNQYKVTINCPEFWVFLVLAIISFILLAFGAYLVIHGVRRNSKYSKLLKDINTKTFVQ